MSRESYYQTAEAAMAAGWRPTDVADPTGRPLWSPPDAGGLVPLEAFLARLEESRAA